jgi:hypothetical protein
VQKKKKEEEEYQYTAVQAEYKKNRLTKKKQR